MYELVEEEEEPSLSSFFEHEILVRLKRTINIMYNIFLICYLDKKSKNTTTNEDTQFNINQFVLQCEGDFTWRASDFEELVGVTWSFSDSVKNYWGSYSELPPSQTHFKHRFSRSELTQLLVLY